MQNVLLTLSLENFSSSNFIHRKFHLHCHHLHQYLEVKTIMVSLKRDRSPFPSVNLPSSRICKNLSRIFPWASLSHRKGKLDKGLPCTLVGKLPPFSYPNLFQEGCLKFKRFLGSWELVPGLSIFSRSPFSRGSFETQFVLSNMSQISSNFWL